MLSLIPPSVRTLAVVGLSKNAGKTTVLGTLIQEVHKHRSLGLVSIGVDGEERDAWSGRTKPAIQVPAGVCVATAGTLLDLQAGAWEVLAATGIYSTLGEVFIARARRTTRVKLAGVNSNEGVFQIVRLLECVGVELTLIDGAYDRKSSANPWLTDANIMVIGASAGSTFDQVMKKTEEWFQLFTLPACQEEWLQLACRQSMEERVLVGVRENRIESLSISTLLSDQLQTNRLTDEYWQAMAVPGVITDRILQRLMAQKTVLPLLVPDATHLFLSLPTLRRYLQSGGEIKVGRNIRILGIAVNPVSAEGYSFPPDEMKQRIAQICHPLPVMDVMRDLLAEGGETDANR